MRLSVTTILLAIYALFHSSLTADECDRDSDDSSDELAEELSIYREDRKIWFQNLSTPEECARACEVDEEPKTCYYHFTVEFFATRTRACNLCRNNATTRLSDDCQCILADGYEKAGLIVANRMYPGPAILVCKYDNVVVDVENRVPGNAITIHWHGIWQNGYQYADGIPYVTQCPIVEETTFRYQWKAKNSGTHFWHAHSGLHKSDGLDGFLIVREPKSIEVNGNLWDYDEMENVIYITDWFHGTSADHFPGTLIRKPRQWPDNFLINGMGQWTHSSGNYSATPLAVFTVKPGFRYRFRMINACGLTCPVQMTIQGHNLMVIASDGEPLVPVNVTSITSLSAERYDFVINTDQCVASYWIQIRGTGQCSPSKIQQLAILRYESAPEEPEIERPSYDCGLETGIVLNEINVICNAASKVSNFVCISQLQNAKPVPPEILKAEPDVRLYMPFGFYDYVTKDIFEPGTYQSFLGEETVGYMGNSTGTLLSNVFPSSPLISQLEDIPDKEICANDNIPSRCSGSVPCMCSHVEEIPLNSVVEIILVDETADPDLSHPFHLHGYVFYLVGEGRAEDYEIPRINVSSIENLVSSGLIKRDLTSPPAKDTFSVPNSGFTIIRFYADNPGYWLFHCHFEFHLAVGMVVTLHVGEPSDLAPVPEGFPKCGNYMPPIQYET